jgi:hypothetical protein
MPLNQYFINYYNNQEQEGNTEPSSSFGAKSFAILDSKKTQFKGKFPVPKQI